MGRDMTWSSAPLIRDDETMAFEAGVNLAVHPAYETGSMFAVICDNSLLYRTAGASTIERSAGLSRIRVLHHSGAAKQ
jgi:hypothetical protein